jgi:hypothetical protein
MVFLYFLIQKQLHFCRVFEEVVIFITNSVSTQMTNSVLSRNVLPPSRLYRHLTIIHVKFCNLKRLLFEHLRDQFIQVWFSYIENSSRGQFYATFKTEFCYENYFLSIYFCLNSKTASFLQSLRRGSDIHHQLRLYTNDKFCPL